MKKETLISIIILVLGLVFVFINIAVFLTKGNRWLIKKKLMMGALILSLTGIIACGSHQQPTCYQQPVTNDHADSIADAKKQDSIKQKLTEDSIANALNEQKKKDSLAKIKHKKKPPVIKPTCYKPAPRPTCYDMSIDTNKLNKD